MTIEDIIRKIVKEELDKRESIKRFMPVAEFCKVKGISRVTVWRAEKEGRIKLKRIGKKIFIDECNL